MKTETKEKLELKHLAPYLPYGLMLSQHREDLNINIESELVSLSADKMRVLLTRFPYSEDVAYYEIKPILRPLSDLTDNEKDYWIEFADLTGLGRAQYFLEAIEKGLFYTVDWRQTKEVLEWLYERHFDVEGLIEKGLAISITDIK